MMRSEPKDRESPYRAPPAGPAPRYPRLARACGLVTRCLEAIRSSRITIAAIVLLLAVLCTRYFTASDAAEFCYLESSGDRVALWGSIRGAPNREIIKVGRVQDALAVAERLGCQVRP